MTELLLLLLLLLFIARTNDNMTACVNEIILGLLFEWLEPENHGPASFALAVVEKSTW